MTRCVCAARETQSPLKRLPASEQHCARSYELKNRVRRNARLLSVIGRSCDRTKQLWRVCRLPRLGSGGGSKLTGKCLEWWCRYAKPLDPRDAQSCDAQCVGPGDRQPASRTKRTIQHLSARHGGAGAGRQPGKPTRSDYPAQSSGSQKSHWEEFAGRRRAVPHAQHHAGGTPVTMLKSSAALGGTGREGCSATSGFPVFRAAPPRRDP